MIYYYKINNLRYTPFDENFWKRDFNYLDHHGLKSTTNKNKADLFIASSLKDLKSFIRRNPMRTNFLLWTNEPRNSVTTKKIFYPFLFFPKVYVMNVYTGNVFVSNVNYQEKRFTLRTPLQILKEDTDLINRKVVALMSFYNGGADSTIIIKDKNVDLIKIRSEIALYGNKKNLIDIFGKGWPKGIAIEDSRTGNWAARKEDILKNYSFNLCFENTVFPKYITEKIWDSIENYCLPIYYGGKSSSIYEIFPMESFIDYADFENPEKLFHYIQKMNNLEFIRRINRCIEVYNNFVKKPKEFWDEISKKRLDNILEKINFINLKIK